MQVKVLKTEQKPKLRDGQHGDEVFLPGQPSPAVSTSLRLLSQLVKSSFNTLPEHQKGGASSHLQW